MVVVYFDTMTSNDWNEIKRLAADFQRAQLTTSIQKLSERNCIEIITKLIEEHLLEVIYTTDAKEFITPKQLIKEMGDELYMHAGRISLTDLSTLLNVELSTLEVHASTFARNEKHVFYVLGELINDNYLDGIAEEINEKLQLRGSITVGEVAKSYDVPGDFAMHFLLNRLGTSIKGLREESDPEIIFTENFVSLHKYQIRGTLSAISKPTPLALLISTFGFQERLFFNIVEKLVDSSILEGHISGDRKASQAIYVPDIYSKGQFEWVNNFFMQNGYLEFEELRRLGISDPGSYIKKNFVKQTLTFVPEACVGQVLIDQIDANLEEALVQGEFVDLAPYFPTSFSNEVCHNLLQNALNNREQAAKQVGCSNAAAQIFCDTIVMSEVLLTKLLLKIEDTLPQKAKEAIAAGAFKHQLTSAKSNTESETGATKNKKEDRRKKAAGGKSGGGTQGRETKTKSTKNKAKGRKNVTNEESTEVSQKASVLEEFLPLEDIKDIISRYPAFEDCIEELFEEVSSYLYPKVLEKFEAIAKELLEATMSAGTDNRKKLHQNLQEKLTLLCTNIRLSSKGIKEFGDDLQVQLSKYLLKTLCTEMVNELLLYLANDMQIEIKGELSIDSRQKIIQQLDADMQPKLTNVNKSLTATSMDPFLTSVEDALTVADIFLKKKDNKKDRHFVLSQRSGLVDQINASINFAATMHLSCLVLFHAVSGNLLHASGKFVPQILAFIKPQLSPEFYNILFEYQSLVMKSLTSKEDCEELSDINSQLEKLTSTIKEMTVSFKKKGQRNSSVSED